MLTNSYGLLFLMLIVGFPLVGLALLLLKGPAIRFAFRSRVSLVVLIFGGILGLVLLSQLIAVITARYLSTQT
jgi:hypothetical protein